MSPSRLESASAQGSIPPASRKFAWDWADDDHDDTWLDDSLNDSSIFSPLSPFTTTSSSIASTVSNSLALTLSEPHLASALSQQPTAILDRAEQFVTLTLPQSPDQEEAPQTRLAVLNPTPPSKLTPKSAWRPIPKANPIDIRVGDTALHDATATEPVPTNKPWSIQSSASSSPVVPVTGLKARSAGPTQSRVYHGRTSQGNLDLSPEAVKLAEKKKSQLCLAYVSGSCPRGGNCVYMHYDVEVAPAEIVETLSSGDFPDRNGSGPPNNFSAVSFVDEPVMQMPFRNPFPTLYPNASTLTIMTTPPVLHNLFISQSPGPSLPSLQPDGWWDKTVYASMPPSPSHGSSSDPLAVVNSSPTAPPSASSRDFQRPPRLHLVESNFTGHGNTRLPGRTRSPRSAISDTILTSTTSAPRASTESNTVNGKQCEASRDRRWSIDGSMRGCSLGPCKYPQVSGLGSLIGHHPPDHTPTRAGPLTNTFENPAPPLDLFPTEGTLATAVPPRPFVSLTDNSTRVTPLPNSTGLTIYPTARVLSGGIRFGDMVSLTSKKGRRAVRAQAEVPKGIKVRDVNAGVIMVDAEMEVAIENARQRAVTQQAQEPACTKPGTQRRGSQPNPPPKRRSSRASVASRRSSVASSTAFSASSGADVICGMYKATGLCRFGTSCKFRHDVEPLNLPGARGSFEMFGTKKPITGSQGARILGSKRRASMPQTASSSSSRSISGLTNASLQTPPSSHAHRSAPPLPSQSSTHSAIGTPHPLRFPMLEHSPRSGNIASDPARLELRVNFPTQQSRQPSLDRIDVMAYPEIEHSTLTDAEHEDMVNVAILQSIMRVPTPLSKPHDKLGHKTLSGLILAETAEPSLDL